MLKLTFIFCMVSMTVSLTIKQQKNKASQSSHPFSYDAENVSKGGYYFVFESPEENHFKHSKGPVLYDHSNQHMEGHTASDSGDDDGSSHHEGGFNFDYYEEIKSHEIPKVEYVYVHSNEADEHDQHSDFEHYSHHFDTTEEKKKEEKVVDYHDHPKYKFVYDVRDYHTGDVKSHEESRDGDEVTGWYSLHEPDGTILEVHYMADKKNGFNARVDRKGKAVHHEVHKKSH